MTAGSWHDTYVNHPGYKKPISHTGDPNENCENCEKLKVEKVDLLTALRDLHDIQNGPPLIRYTKEWNEIMGRTIELLETLEGGGK